MIATGNGSEVFDAAIEAKTPSAPTETPLYVTRNVIITPPIKLPR